jgi:hypothetical protein
VTKRLYVQFTKNQKEIFAKYCDKSAAAIFTKNQNLLLHNTATKLLHLAFTNNQNQLFEQYSAITLTRIIHKESKPIFCKILRQNSCS